MDKNGGEITRYKATYNEVINSDTLWGKPDQTVPLGTDIKYY